jgi:phage tail-like protein
LASDGTDTPRIHQIRVEFDYASYLPYLPAFYSEDKETRRFLLPALSLFESFFSEQEWAITNLPAIFDSEAAKSEFLGWLAEWVAQDIEEGWSDDRKRRMIAEAFAAYARRGTPSGLRSRIQGFAGIQAQILEPLVNSGLWSLGQSSVLNFDTSLASAEAQGAVVGLSASLDHSYLITEAEFGAPLFEELAHRFSVVIYPNAANSPQRMAKLKSVIERDKPAHTDYHICIVQPKMRVGFQSMLGIDTVVGGPATATPLADQAAGGLVLAGLPPAMLGEGAQVGTTAQLG